MHRGRQRGTDWEGQQRERVRTEQVEWHYARADHSGAGQSSGTGGFGDIDPRRTDKLYFLCFQFYSIFSSFSVLVLCDDVTGLVERPVRDGVANPGALVLCLIVEDPFNVERFLASVDIFTAVPNTDDRERFG